MVARAPKDGRKWGRKRASDTPDIDIHGLWEPLTIKRTVRLLGILKVYKK